MRWVVALALAHFSAALFLGEREFADYFTWEWLGEVLTILVIPPIVVLVLMLIQSVRAKPDSLLGHVRNRMYEERIRFIDGAVLLICYALVNRAYRAIKVSIPSLNDYFADPMFIEWDYALFGADPWRISHALLGPLGTQFLDMLYVLWFPVIVLAFGFSAFAKDRSFRVQATASYFLIWIALGNVMAVWLASVGPTFYDDFFQSDRFAPLMEQLNHYTLAAPNIQQFLLSTTDDASIGSGISAMPSVHCAMTMLIVMMVWDRYGFGWQLLLAVAYHLGILIGSVHLAWHYAVDGIISSLLVPILWIVAGRIAHWSDEQERTA